MNPTPAGTRRRTQRRERADDRLRRERGEPLPAWLATRTSRRALALVPAATFALGVWAAVSGGGSRTAVIGLAASVLASSGIVRLRRATRMLDAAPDGVLDEREIADRDHAHRLASRLTLVLLGALVLLAVVNGLLAQETGVQLVSPPGWAVLLFDALLAAAMLPAAALAWDWRAPVDGDEDGEFDG